MGPCGVPGWRGATRPSRGPVGFLPRAAGALGDLPGDGIDPEPQAVAPDLDLELDADEDDEYVLS